MKKEYGRSMIEMLGVLAIIGVLSIGGLAGYTMAMNRHKANNLLDYISRCAVIVQTKGDGSTEISGDCKDLAGLGAEPTTDIGTIAYARDTAGKVTLTAEFDDADSVDTAVKSRFSTNTNDNPHITSAGAIVFGS